MASQQFEKIRSDVTKKLHEKNAITDVLGQVETKTGVDRFYIVSGSVFHLFFGWT